MPRFRSLLVLAAVLASVTWTLPAGSAGASHRSAGPGGDTLLTEPQQGYQPVYALILGAMKSVEMTMYELSDPVAESDLAADSHRGVDVRVVLDKDYSGKKVNAPAYRYLARNGVHVVWSYPNEIFHQKTITVDGTESLVLTGNLTAKYYATTRDFGVFDTDTADVSAITSAFASDFAGHEPAPARTGADLVWSPGSQTELVSLINSARHTLSIENEEMDSATIESALQAAAQRGVQVDVTMTYSSSWTAALDKLSAAGVKVQLYHGETPIYIHAKVISVDAGTSRQRAFIGSENFSNSSLRYNRELGVVTTNPAILTPLNATLASDFAGTPDG
jgi:phosphatidylserine/phosphatidylglycerophosphate/cardiolipin synthase-like enzyme